MCEKRFGRLLRHLSALGQSTKRALDLFGGIESDRDGEPLHGYTAIACHEGRVSNAEARMHDLVRQFGFYGIVGIGGTIFEAHDHLDLGSDRVLVKLEGLSAFTVVVKIDLN